MTTKLSANESLKAAGVRFDSKMTNGPLPEWAGSGSHSWKVTIRFRGRQLTVPFYTGSMCGEVTAADVLHCLISDSRAIDQSFEEWASDLDYDTDSRKAEATYNACVKGGKKLQKLLGSEFDSIAKLLEDY